MRVRILLGAPGFQMSNAPELTTQFVQELNETSDDYAQWAVTGKSNSQVIFEKFVASGYDIDSVPVEDLHHVVSAWKIILIPALPPYSWESQDARGKQWPWIFAKAAELLQRDRWKLQAKIEEQKRELIEVRKELSQLKRAKK